MAAAEHDIRSYLEALRDPSSLRDEEAINETSTALDAEEDPIERLKLRQKLEELQSPSLEKVEDAFVMHAKAWAEEVGISEKAFAAEGVSASTLRRAGFNVGKARSAPARASSGGARKSKRVTTEEVIAAMPAGAFTVKALGEISGASPAVVRGAIKDEVAAGRLVEAGPDPDHSGPGRAPALYRKA